MSSGYLSHDSSKLRPMGLRDDKAVMDVQWWLSYAFDHFFHDL